MSRFRLPSTPSSMEPARHTSFCWKSPCAMAGIPATSGIDSKADEALEVVGIRRYCRILAAGHLHDKILADLENLDSTGGR